MLEDQLQLVVDYIGKMILFKERLMTSLPPFTSVNVVAELL